MRQNLTILTTADASTEVMQAFAATLSCLDLCKQANLTWLVVDGLHAHAPSPCFWGQHPPFRVQWIRPALPLPQLPAIMLGLHSVKGPVVVMDPDMADNLTDVQKFQRSHAKGSDVVFGWRTRRVGISRSRRALTLAFNQLAKRLLQLTVHDLNTPMISLTSNAVQCLLTAPHGCPSPRLYVYHESKNQLDEVRITTREHPQKKSAYNMRMRLLLGVAQLYEILAFLRYMKAHQKAR